MAELQLTPAQQAAVTRPGGPILVSAAAGSGKTKVLVERLMHRVCREENPCDVDDFLIITFTKKAAAELRARIAAELAGRLSRDPENRHLQRQQSRVYLAQISTIHAFCGQLLRQHAYTLDLPGDFRVGDQAECDELQSRLVEELLEDRYAQIEQDPDLQSLVDSLGAGRGDWAVAELVLGVYRTAQCRLYPRQWLRECLARLDAGAETDPCHTIWGESLLQGGRQALAPCYQALLPALEVVDSDPAFANYQGAVHATEEICRTLLSDTDWDTLAALAAKPGFGALRALPKAADRETAAWIKAAREDCKTQAQKLLKYFYAPADRVMADLASTRQSLTALVGLVEAFSDRYAARKRQRHMVDYNDLEHGAVRLLLQPGTRAPTAAAREIARQFAEILVDEYQDTNEVQDCIFRAISRGGKNRFMVGDVKQSIYRFRMADPGIFLDKYRRYPDMETVGPEDRQRILLSHNFRSCGPILDAANAVFARCMTPETGGLAYTDAEALRLGRPHPALPGPQVELHCLDAVESGEGLVQTDRRRLEADYVARRLRQMLDEGTLITEGEGTRPVRPGDMVILLRSGKNTTRFFLEALQRQGIPCTSEGEDSLLQSRELETLTDLLQCVDNLHQDIPLAGALLSPLFAIDPNVLAMARSAKADGDLYDALAAWAPNSPALARALELLDALRCQAQELPLYSLLAWIDRQLEVEAVFGAMAQGDTRVEHLRQFRELAAAFDPDGQKSLHRFVEYLLTLRLEGAGVERPPAPDAVTVMTMHKSKGLEFPVVVLADLAKGFNLTDTHAQVLFHETLGIGSTVFDPALNARYASLAKTAIAKQLNRETKSEELRVLYVAMTRPMDRLILTYCAAKLDKQLEKLCKALESQSAAECSANAGRMGDWVLLTALARPEGEPLRDRPLPLAAPDDSPWRIVRQTLTPASLAEAPAPAAPAPGPEPPAPVPAMAAPYAHPGAAGVSAKLTATQLKGRPLDEEAQSAAPAPVFPGLRLRKPSLLRRQRPLTPAERGTAMHLAMQYLDFAQTDTLAQIDRQLQHLEEEAFLTPQQAQSVDRQRLLRIFRGPVGEMIRRADRVVREFKFSLLVDAGLYAPQAAGEQLMLQGVTDCCLIKNGRLTVIDFKTDRVRPGEEALAAEKYRGQLQAYSLALERIFRLPVEQRLLYFFATDAVVACSDPPMGEARPD